MQLACQMLVVGEAVARCFFDRIKLRDKYPASCFTSDADLYGVFRRAKLTLLAG